MFDVPVFSDSFFFFSYSICFFLLFSSLSSIFYTLFFLSFYPQIVPNFFLLLFLFFLFFFLLWILGSNQLTWFESKVQISKISKKNNTQSPKMDRRSDVFQWSYTRIKNIISLSQAVCQKMIDDVAHHSFSFCERSMTSVVCLEVIVLITMVPYHIHVGYPSGEIIFPYLANYVQLIDP